MLTYDTDILIWLVKTVLAYAKAWHHVDASGRTLGQLAGRIATVLMGKHKPIYDPSGMLKKRLRLETYHNLMLNSGLRRLCCRDEREENTCVGEQSRAEGVLSSHNVSGRFEGASF